MQSAIFVCALAALALPRLTGADLLDNQLDDSTYAFRYSRPSSRARVPVKGCRPCAINECQVMGMQRFSEPRCEALGELGSPCRMWQDPENKTLSFPDKLLQCNNVYMQFCPCAKGLVCHEAECKRQPGTKPRMHTSQLEREELNGFDVEEENDDDLDAEDRDMPVAFEPAKSRFPWAVARLH